jgi:hypothetical protein
MWTFCDDVQKREFYVPAGLLRVEDLSSSMKTIDNIDDIERSIGARTRSRVCGRSTQLPATTK